MQLTHVIKLVIRCPPHSLYLMVLLFPPGLEDNDGSVLVKLRKSIVSSIGINRDILVDSVVKKRFDIAGRFSAGMLSTTS